MFFLFNLKILHFSVSCFSREKTNEFFTLDLEYHKINSLALSWTLVHLITNESPLFDFTASDFESVSGEIIVIIKTFDDMFSTVVATRTSYTFNEIIYGVKFNPMHAKSKDNLNTILDMSLLNSFVPVVL